MVLIKIVQIIPVIISFIFITIMELTHNLLRNKNNMNIQTKAHKLNIITNSQLLF